MTPHAFRSLLALVLLPSLLWAQDWPRFRGPTGQGIADEAHPPLTWSRTENVVWSLEIPGAGWSSPIVQGDRVFVTTAAEEGASCRVLCVERASGSVLWDREVFRQTPGNIQQKNSHATPTPAADEERVYAVFGDGSIVALSLDGEIAWTNRDFKFYSQHGLGASPILYQDLLIMPFDGSSSDDKLVGWQKPWDQAVIVALDKKTGEVRWKGSRGLSRIAHSTPVIVRHEDRDLLVSTAGDVIQGFDPQTGERLWSVANEGEGLAPSPAYGNGLVFCTSGFGKPALRAVRVDGRGEVTKTHIAWEQTKTVSMIPSPICVNGHVFMISEKGVAVCLDPKDGRAVWQERIGGNHSASPVFAAGKLFFLSEEGETAIVEAQPQFKLVGRNSVDEACQASIAVSGGQFFLRTERRLLCIGKPTAE